MSWCLMDNGNSKYILIMSRASYSYLTWINYNGNAFWLHKNGRAEWSFITKNEIFVNNDWKLVDL